MEVAVWDTYVKREGGLVMHFDILVDSAVNNEPEVLAFGEQYLKSRPFKSEQITSKQCKFCHIEQANQVLHDEIEDKGFVIIEMENCN